MLLGQISVVLRTNGASFDFFDIAAITDPFRTQRRQAVFDVATETRIAPGTAGVVNAHRLVHFNLAGHCFCWRERYFAERNFDVCMQFAGDIDLSGVGQRFVGGVRLFGTVGRLHRFTEIVRDVSTPLDMTKDATRISGCSTFTYLSAWAASSC